MSAYQLAQLNVGHPKYDLDAPGMAEFMDNIDGINAQAEQHPGFIWRLTGDNGNATEFTLDDQPLLIPNLSVWDSVESLKDYVYTGDHVSFVKRRHEWFKKIDGPVVVLWWIPAGHQPTLSEANERLQHLKQYGPSEFAFLPHKPFPAPTAAKFLDLEPVSE